MSYSALTELGFEPQCPRCKKTILPGQKVALVLASTANIVEAYNVENELEHEESVTVDMDWTDQVAFHRECVDELFPEANYEQKS